MRLVQYTKNAHKNVYLAIEESSGRDLIPLPGTIQDLIERGKTYLDEIKVQMSLSDVKTINRNMVNIIEPISEPTKILGIGLNYTDGADEMEKEYPTSPIVFLKLPSTIMGSSDPLPLPRQSNEVVWEVELAIIIGKQGRNIKKEDALDHVFGYTVAIDYTARDLIKKNAGLWTLAKNFDGFCALGPAIVISDEINPKNLRMTTKVNGEVKQDSNTKNMIFDVVELVTYLSTFYKLLPGDIILTGTPAGVGVARQPPEFIGRGDTIECEIQGIGTITNRAVILADN